MHGLGSVIFWIAVIGHFAGVAGILAGIVLRFRKDSPMAATAVFHSTTVMLVTGFLLIWAESLHGEAFSDEQNAIIGLKAFILLVMMGLAMWLRRGQSTDAAPAANGSTSGGEGAAAVEGAIPAAAPATTAADSKDAAAKPAGGPLWVYYTLAVMLTMNFTMGLIVAYVL